MTLEEIIKQVEQAEEDYRDILGVIEGAVIESEVL